MKRLARHLLPSCLIAALAACTGSAATPAPSHTRSAPVAVTSPATSASPVPTPLPPTTTTSPVPAPPPPTQSEVALVTGYYRAILTRNYQKAFGYLAPGATGPDGQKMTLGSFLQLAQMLDNMGGPVTQFSIEGLRSEVVMTIYRAKYGPYHAHLQMVLTRQGWTIGSIDRI